MKELDELDRLTKEIAEEGEKERRNRKPLIIFWFILMGVGFPMLIYYTSWQVGVAVFLLLWANNISVKLNQ